MKKVFYSVLQYVLYPSEERINLALLAVPEDNAFRYFYHILDGDGFPARLCIFQQDAELLKTEKDILDGIRDEVFEPQDFNIKQFIQPYSTPMCLQFTPVGTLAMKDDVDEVDEIRDKLLKSYFPFEPESKLDKNMKA